MLTTTVLAFICVANGQRLRKFNGAGQVWEVYQGECTDMNGNDHPSRNQKKLYSGSIRSGADKRRCAETAWRRYGSQLGGALDWNGRDCWAYLYGENSVGGGDGRKNGWCMKPVGPSTTVLKKQVDIARSEIGSLKRANSTVYKLQEEVEYLKRQIKTMADNTNRPSNGTALVGDAEGTQTWNAGPVSITYDDGASALVGGTLAITALISTIY